MSRKKEKGKEMRDDEGGRRGSRGGAVDKESRKQDEPRAISHEPLATSVGGRTCGSVGRLLADSQGSWQLAVGSARKRGEEQPRLAWSGLV